MNEWKRERWETLTVCNMMKNEKGFILLFQKCGISSIEKETFKKLEELRELILTEVKNEQDIFQK